MALSVLTVSRPRYPLGSHHVRAQDSLISKTCYLIRLLNSAYLKHPSSSNERRKESLDMKTIIWRSVSTALVKSELETNILKILIHTTR